MADIGELFARGITREEEQKLLGAVLAYKARASGSKSFAAFVKQAWPYVMQVDPLVWGWHMDALCMHFEEVARGGIRRLLVNIAPGHAKSVIMSVLWPAWVWTWWPKCQFLFTSHSAEFSVRDSIRCRAVLESPWYRETYMKPGGWTLRSDQNAKNNFINTAGGERFASGIGGTGRRAHIIGVDDPLEQAKAQSKAERDHVKDWISGTLSQRFVDAQTGRIAMIMQRLHDEDPSGYVLEVGGWQHLILPSEYDPQHSAFTFRELDGESVPFWSDPRTFKGEPLFPEKFPPRVLDEYKRTMGAYSYAAQHDQNPRPAGGNLFERSWWRFWKPDGTAPEHGAHRPKDCYQGPARVLPQRFDAIIVSVDANFKNSVTADPVAIHVYGASGTARFLLHRVHGPFGFTKTVHHLRECVAYVTKTWGRPRKVIIEAKANGDAIIETLQDEIDNVIGVNPEGGKESRAMAGQPIVEAGNMYLPDGAPFLDAFIEEFSAFPRGKHDDDVDAWSQAMNEFVHGPETTAMLMLGGM